MEHRGAFLDSTNESFKTIDLTLCESEASVFWGRSACAGEAGQRLNMTAVLFNNGTDPAAWRAGA